MNKLIEKINIDRKLKIIIIILIFSFLLLSYFHYTKFIKKFTNAIPLDENLFSMKNNDFISQHIEKFGNLPDRKDLKRFDKFLFFYIDSLPYDVSNSVISTFFSNNNNINLFRILNTGYKFSFAIVSTYVTGKPLSNYEGKNIMGDSIFKQFKNAGYNVTYEGNDEVYDKIFAPETFSKFEKQIHDKQRLFEWFFHPSNQEEEKTNNVAESEENHKKLVYKLLNEKTFDGKNSILFGTSQLDVSNHDTFKYSERSLNLVKNFNHDIQIVTQWIDEHPDYLFILLSDHGGQEYHGEDAVILHGKELNGNEPVLLLYNKDLTFSDKEFIDTFHVQDNGEPILIDNVDVVSTIAQYFNNVSIPLESTGMIRPRCDILEYKYEVYKNNARQMLQLLEAKKYNSKYPKIRKNLSEKFSDLSEDQVNSRIKEFTQFIHQVKIQFKNFKSVDYSGGIFGVIFLIVIWFAQSQGIGFIIGKKSFSLQKIIQSILNHFKNPIKFLDFKFLLNVFLILHASLIYHRAADAMVFLYYSTYPVLAVILLASYVSLYRSVYKNEKIAEDSINFYNIFGLLVPIFLNGLMDGLAAIFTNTPNIMADIYTYLIVFLFLSKNYIYDNCKN